MGGERFGIKSYLKVVEKDIEKQQGNELERVSEAEREKKCIAKCGPDPDKRRRRLLVIIRRRRLLQPHTQKKKKRKKKNKRKRDRRHREAAAAAAAKQEKKKNWNSCRRNCESKNTREKFEKELVEALQATLAARNDDEIRKAWLEEDNFGPEECFAKIPVFDIKEGSMPKQRTCGGDKHGAVRAYLTFSDRTVDGFNPSQRW